VIYDLVDMKEHAYWQRFCPACNHSPCLAGDHKGSCLTLERTAVRSHADVERSVRRS
jgi:hypothetical protein